MKNKKVAGYCPRCGAAYGDTFKVCAKCGVNLSINIKFKQGRQIPTYEDTIDTMCSDAQYCLLTLSKRAKVSGIIWIVIATVQVILSVIAFPFPFWVAAVVNIMWALSRFRHSKQILHPNKKLIEKYNSSWYHFSWVLSLTLGGFIGLIGCVYDDRTKGYAHTNAGLIEWYCNVR